MRRTAVLVVFIALALGCKETWLLPGGVSDGGRDPDGGGGKGGGPGTGGTSGRGAGGMAGPPCHDRMRITIETAKTADLVFSIGRNASMSTSFGSGNGTRMSVVQQAVRNVVMERQDAVNFGYQDFPSAVSCFNSTACCANSKTVFPNQNTYGAINQAMRECDGTPPRDGCTSLSESRPIGEALGAINPPPPRFPIFLDPYDMIDRELVLIVDGAPGCTSQDPMQACTAAVMQVSQLKKAHINTYVIPVGEEAEASDCLRQMALQAGTETAPVPFSYPARDMTQLMQSLNQIVSKAAASCVINLLSPVPADNRQVEVNIRNKNVPYDENGQDGWNFVAGSPGKIELHGSSCDALQQGQGAIEIWSTCPH